MTGGESPLETQPTSTCLGIDFKYMNGLVHLSMGPFAKMLLASHGMLDCNISTLPMTPGFTLTKDDQPTNDSERQTIVDEVCTLSPGATVTCYAEVVTLYRSITKH